MTLPGVRSIFVNAGHLAIARVFNIAVRFFYVLALARFLGPELYGLYAYAQAFYLAILPVAALGLGAVIARGIGRDRASAPGIAGSSIAFRAVTSVVGAVACAGAGVVVETTPLGRILILIFAGALLGRGLAMWAQHIFAAYEASRHTLIQEVTLRPAEAVVGLALLAAGGGVLSVAVLHAAVWWLQAAQGLWTVHRRFHAVAPRWERSALMRLLRQCVPIGAGGLLVVWMQQGPLVLARHSALTPGELGQFALLMQIFLVAGTMPQALTASAIPVLSRSASRADGKDVRFVEMMTALAILGGTAIAIAGDQIGPLLIPAVFGASYAAAGDLLGAPLGLMVFITIGSAGHQMLLARDRWAPPLIAAAAGVLALLLAWLLLQQQLGLLAPIAAMAAGMVVWNGLLLGAVFRSDVRRLGRALVWPGLSAAAAVSLYIGMGQNHPVFAVAIALAALVPCIALLGMRGPGVRDALATALRWRRSVS